MYRRFVDNGKLAVLTSARRENGFPPKCKTSTGNKFDFRSPSPSQKSALLKVPILGFHCHAIKNKIANHSIQKVPNLGNKRR